MAWPDSDYPGGIDSPLSPDTNLSGTPDHDELHLYHNDALVKLMTELGTNPSGSESTVAARFAAAEVTRTTTITAASGISNVAGQVVRVPIPGAGALLIYDITAQNTKGSALATGDDICTVPAGFRPSSDRFNLPGMNISGPTLPNITWGVSSAGLVEFTNPAATVSNGNYIRLQAVVWSSS